MLSELTITVLRYAFLLLLWTALGLILLTLRHDLGLGERAGENGRPRRRFGRAAPAVPPAQVPSTVTPPPSPAIPRPTHVAVLEGPRAGTTFPLGNVPIILGRAEDATFVLADDYASGRHARLFPQGSRWFVEDLGSTNGTLVGGASIMRATPVPPGTPVKVGQTVLELRP